MYGEFTEISFRFTVDAGPNVDIFIFPEEDFARYLASEPYSEFAGRLENVRSVEESPYGSEGTYIAVIDNSEYGLATPSGANVVVRYYIGAGGIPGETHDDYITKYVVFGLGLLILGFVFLIGIVLVVVDRPGEPFCWRWSIP